MKEKKLVLFIVKNRALGDSVMGLSSIAYLRELYPDAYIIYATPAWVAPLYEKVETAADFIYPLKMKSLSDILNLYSDLFNLKVDAIHEMHQSGTGNKVFTFFSLLKSIPYTFHNHHLRKGTVVLDQGEKKELIQRDLDGLYSYFSFKKDIPSFLNFVPQIKSNSILERKKRIIFGVVATRKTKMWPLESFAELAKLIVETHPTYEIIIPLSKSLEDQSIKKTLAGLLTSSNATIVEWPLSTLPEEFLQAQFYIGNDTGLKHLAIAAGVQTFTFFGPEPVREWHPYDKDKHPYFYLENLACRTREQHYCGLSVCDLNEENMKCLKVFKAKDVLLKIANYM